MEWVLTAFSGVGLFVVSSVGTWAVTKWRARRASAQWTLELVNGDEWTVRRDSPLTAFALHMYDIGDGSRAPEVIVIDYFDRMDIHSGEEVHITGVRAGMELRLDWVEGSARLASRSLIREGTSKVVIVRRDTRLYA